MNDCRLDNLAVQGDNASMDFYTFLLSGYFMSGEIDVETLQAHLKVAGGKPLVVQVSSVGGDVEIGTGIRNALIQYKAEHNVDIKFDVLGWAQSMGSLITTVPGTKTTVCADSIYMLHNPSAYAFGDYVAMQKKHDWLMLLTDVSRAAYSQKSGKSIEEITAMLDAETFLMGQEIVDAGFADELADNGTGTAVASGDKAERIKQAKTKYEEFKAVALGTVKPQPAPQALEDDMTIIKKPAATPAPAGAAPVAEATGAPAPAVDNSYAEALQAQAKAFAVAMRKLPIDQHIAVQAAFDAGQDASFFEGMVAQHTAVAAATAKGKEAAAQASAQAVGDEINTTAVPTPMSQERPLTAGETGKTIEVGR